MSSSAHWTKVQFHKADASVTNGSLDGPLEVTLQLKGEPALEVKVPNVADDELLTAEELADFLRVHRSTVYRLLRNGHLPAFRVGSDWRFSRDLIEEWLQSRIRTTPG
jgi:excisionase family DNA binding protein